jgi:hypothetical protein
MRWVGICSVIVACSQGAAPSPGESNGGSAGASSAGQATAIGGSTVGGSAGSPNNTTQGGAGAGTGAGAAGASSVAGMSGTGGAAGGAGGSTNGGGGSSSGGASGAGGADSGLPKRVLLYHFSTLNIDSVPAQITALTDQLKTWGYEVEESVDPSKISSENLARFGGVGMINTCFEPFGAKQMGDAQTTALRTFVENGGGLFGTHCASVTFQNVEPPHAYNALIGGRGGHGSFDGKSACTTTAAHPTTQDLPATFDFDGNLDNADYVATDSTVLVKCQWSGGDKKNTAVSWYRTPGKGRVFYTNFAKIDADLKAPLLGQKHIFPGLAWVLHRN